MAESAISILLDRLAPTAEEKIRRDAPLPDVDAVASPGVPITSALSSAAQFVKISPSHLQSQIDHARAQIAHAEATILHYKNLISEYELLMDVAVHSEQKGEVESAEAVAAVRDDDAEAGTSNIGDDAAE